MHYQSCGTRSMAVTGLLLFQRFQERRRDAQLKIVFFKENLSSFAPNGETRRREILFRKKEKTVFYSFIRSAGNSINCDSWLLLFYTGVFLVLLVFFSGVNALAWNSITTASILGNSLKWLDTLFFLNITAKKGRAGHWLISRSFSTFSFPTEYI